MLCSAASRLGLGDNNKRELESERKKRRRRRRGGGRGPSIHACCCRKSAGQGEAGAAAVCVCAGGLVRDPKKGPGNATIFTRVARYQTPKETRDRTNTRPPAAWPCQGCFLRTHAWTFSCAAAAASVLLPRARSSAVDASNVQRLGGRRGSLGASYDARGQTRGYETAA